MPINIKPQRIRYKFIMSHRSHDPYKDGRTVARNMVW